MAKRRRTEIAFIADPAARLVTFSKRRKGLFNKASELCRLCDARAAVVVFSCAGKPYSFGDPSADDVISDYLRVSYLRVSDGDGGVVVKPQMDLVQWEKWVDADLNACATEQELERFISKYEALRDGVRQKLRALEEEKSQVNVGGGGDSHALTEEEIDEIFNSLDRSPALPDLLADVDQDVVMISSENRAVGCGSSAVESNSARSDLEGCRTNAAGDGSLGAATIPTRSDLEDGEFDLVGLLTRLAAGGGFL